jgi:hypothetical protein
MKRATDAVLSRDEGSKKKQQHPLYTCSLADAGDFYSSIL